MGRNNLRSRDIIYYNYYIGLFDSAMHFVSSLNNVPSFGELLRAPFFSCSAENKEKTFNHKFILMSISQ